MIFLNPQPEKQDLNKYYPENYGPYIEEKIIKHGSITKLLRKIKLSLGSKFENRNKKIDNSTKKYLDFGCGGGFNLERKKKAYPKWDLYGLDVNEQACQSAKDKGFAVYFDKDLSCQLPDKFFDIINMSQVLEHLDNPIVTLKRLRGALRDDGMLTISIPNYDSYSRRIFKSFWYALDVPRHLFHFTPTTLKEILKKSGFELTKIKFWDNPKIFIKSFCYVIGLGNRAINPILWKMVLPFSKLAAKNKKSSQISVYARKIN